MLSSGDRETSRLEPGIPFAAPTAPSQQSAENPLTAEEIETYRQHLQHLREWLLGSIAQLEAKFASPGSGGRRVSFESFQSDDGAWEQSVAQSSVADKRLLLQDIMQAFERIGQNTYGRCVADNAAIPRSLLEEVPHARYCAICASRHDS